MCVPHLKGIQTVKMTEFPSQGIRVCYGHGEGPKYLQEDHSSTTDPLL